MALDMDIDSLDTIEERAARANKDRDVLTFHWKEVLPVAPDVGLADGNSWPEQRRGQLRPFEPLVASRRAAESQWTLTRHCELREVFIDFSHMRRDERYTAVGL